MKNYFSFCALFFLLQPSSAQDLAWAKQMGGTGYDFGGFIAIDATGNIYTTGSFEGIADLDPGAAMYNVTANGIADIFVSKADASGNFIWSKTMGGAGAEGYGYSIAADASGNVYGAGYFTGTIDFDPGAGTFSLSSAGDYDFFIFKLDASGNFLWAKQTGGTDFDIAYAMTIDASGHVYTTGFFAGTVDFDPGTGTFNLTTIGDYDLFISKLDASGNFVWAKSMGGSGVSEASAYAIALDASGNVYTTGEFWGTVDFDPGAGTSNLIATGGYDMFLLKLDASGNYVWAKGIGGSGYDFGSAITVDASGNVFTTGSFRGTVDFDPGAGTFLLTGGGFDEIFVLKLDASGNLVWARSMGGTGTDWGTSIALDASGNVYTTGNFEGSVDFDPGAGTFSLTAMGETDIFISKLNASGNFAWAKQIGGPGANPYPYSMIIDASGTLYSTGEFYGVVDFDPGTGTFNLTPAGEADIFIYKISQCVTAPPVVTIAPGNSAICQGNSIQLTASGADTYTWTPAAGLNTTTGAIVTASPTSTTTYTVSGTTAGCSGISSITITVNPTPNVSVSAVTPTICQGGSTQLNATGATSYTWSPAAGLSATTGASVSAAPAATTTYTVTGTTDGCSQSQDVTVMVNPVVTPSITFNFSGCPGNSLVFTAAFTNGGSSPQVSWFVNNIPSGTGTTFNLNNATNGMQVYATLTSSAACATPQQVTSGTTSISCITTAIPVVSDLESFSVSPNPGNGIITVQMKLLQIKKVDLLVRDCLGRKIFSLQPVAVNGSYQQMIDLSMHPAGVYYIEARIGNQVVVDKIIIQR